jgi:hypothetical protein
MSPGITPRRSVRSHMHPRLDASQAFEWRGLARVAAATGPAEYQSVTLVILPSTLHDNQRLRSPVSNQNCQPFSSTVAERRSVFFLALSCLGRCRVAMLPSTLVSNRKSCPFCE